MYFHSGRLAETQMANGGMAFLRNRGETEMHNATLLRLQLRNGTLSFFHWLNQVTWQCLKLITYGSLLHKYQALGRQEETKNLLINPIIYQYHLQRDMCSQLVLISQYLLCFCWIQKIHTGECTLNVEGDPNTQTWIQIKSE